MVGSILALGGTVINALLIFLLVFITCLVLITMWFYHNTNTRLIILPIWAHGATNSKTLSTHSSLQRMRSERDYGSFKVSGPANDGHGFDHAGPNNIFSNNS
jgi:hypothetical protein